MAYNKNLGYDPDIKDYSALIANTKDTQTRAALLEQRQNKLNHLDTTGGRDSQWADNSTVSTWTSTYQPGGWNDNTASYNPKSSGSEPSFSADRAYTQYRTLMQDQYDKSALAQQQALQASVDKGVAALQGQVQDVNTSYDDLARQAYISYMKGAKELPYKLSAGGLTGGATESAMVSLGTSYQETLGQSERERLKALRQIDSEMAALQSTGDIEKANATAKNASQYASALQDIYQSLLSAQQNEAQSIANNAYRQQQFTATTQQQEYERRLAIAKLLAEAGDFSGYAQMGINTTSLEEAYRRQQELAASTARSTSGSRSRRTGTSTKEIISAVDAVQKQSGDDDDMSDIISELLASTSDTPVSASVQTAARTYGKELMRLYSNDTEKVYWQIAKDYKNNFISKSLAKTTYELVWNGEVWAS